jgi:hypothetical protein
VNGDFSDEDLKKIDLFRIWITYARFGDNEEEKWQLSDCVESRQAFIQSLSEILLIARKAKVSTTALGKAIALIAQDKENWESMLEVYGTVCELQIISGNPPENRWYRVPTQYLRGKKSDWYDWKRTKADRFRAVAKGVKEIREDALPECVKPQFIKSLTGDAIKGK